MKNLFKKNRGSSDEKAGEQAEVDQRTVLVVDDSPTELHVLRNILEKEGFKVETAEDGQQGIDVAKKIHPDVILMDVVMPVLNGFQATRELSNNDSTSDIPVIMVTTKNQETDKRWGLRQGAKDYLVKPVEATELLHKIKAVVGG